jgi:hypothetical protein
VSHDSASRVRVSTPLETATLKAAAAPATKALGFNSMVKVLREILTPEQYQRFIRRLPNDTAALIAKPPLPLSWIPCRHRADVVTTALTVSFGGDEERLAALGRGALLFDLKTLYKLFIKLLSPQHVMERSASLWLTYNRDNGVVRAVETGPHSCEVHYQEIAVVYPGFWAYQKGAILGVGAATGFSKTDVRLLKGGRNEGQAVFAVAWEK